jgi:hypothetical protein
MRIRLSPYTGPFLRSFDVGRGGFADHGSRRGNELPGSDQMTKVIVAVCIIFITTTHHVYNLSLLLILLCFQLRVPVHYRGVNSPHFLARANVLVRTRGTGIVPSRKRY